MSLPVDATVHQLNADTVHFIESVEPFYETLGQIIAKKDERSVSPVEAYVNYKSDLLSALSMNLNNKAEDYKNQSAKCVFLMVIFVFKILLFTSVFNSSRGFMFISSLEKRNTARAKFRNTAGAKFTPIFFPEIFVSESVLAKNNDKIKSFAEKCQFLK